MWGCLSGGPPSPSCPGLCSTWWHPPTGSVGDRRPERHSLPPLWPGSGPVLSAVIHIPISPCKCHQFCIRSHNLEQKPPQLSRNTISPPPPTAGAACRHRPGVAFYHQGVLAFCVGSPTPNKKQCHKEMKLVQDHFKIIYDMLKFQNNFDYKCKNFDNRMT